MAARALMQPAYLEGTPTAPPRLLAAASPAGLAPAEIIEADPLVRLHAAHAAAELGFAALPTVCDARRHQEQPDVVFIGLDCLEHCPRCRARTAGPLAGATSAPGASPVAPFTVGYAAGPAAVLAAHAAHHCTDSVMLLRAVAGRAVFAHPTGQGLTGTVWGGAGHADELLPADLTPREADVLLLVLAGFSTAEIAARLWLSPATARSHCRAILRKCGAADRRALRARFIGASHGASTPSACPICTPWPRPAG